jgi:polysaccharide biosynthesis/export protein
MVAVQPGPIGGAVRLRHMSFIRGSAIVVGAASAILGLSACTAPPEIALALPPPPQPGPYLLQASDQLDIKFFHNPELNEQVTIQPDGKLTVALQRDLPAAGRSLEEVARAISEAYSRELRDPAVSVQLRSALPSRVYVGGEVVTPGEFVTVGPPLTLTQAIARAGGLKNSANMQQIVLVRRDGTGAKAYGIDFLRAAVGADRQDVVLEAYDTIFVPRSGVANVYLAYQQYFQQFLPVSFGGGLQFTP